MKAMKKHDMSFAVQFMSVSKKLVFIEANV